MGQRPHVIASPNAMERIEALRAELDIDIPGDEQINVHTLENADAKEVAANLETLVSGSRGKGAAVAGQPSGGGMFGGEVKITANESKNALLIVASPTDYRSLSKVIEQLATPQRQVLIENGPTSSARPRTFDAWPT